MTDERLIEEVAKSIRFRAVDADYEDTTAWLQIARAALAVFEKAHTPHTPTDDEREALSEFLFTVYEHGTQPNALKEADAILTFLAGFRRSEPQVESSDAQRKAAADAVAAHFVPTEGVRANDEREWACGECGWAFGWWRPSDHGPDVARRRAEHLADVALRAASEVGGARTFPASFRMDRTQALHEVWSAATNRDVAMSEEGFRDAVAVIEGKPDAALITRAERNAEALLGGDQSGYEGETELGKLILKLLGALSANAGGEGR